MGMNSRVAGAVTFLAVAAGVGCGTFDKRGEVDKLFATWDRKDSPGCAVGVSQGGKVVLTRSYGMSSIELGVPIAVDSVFPAASISKQFTAMSILLLAKHGKLSLDDPIQKFVAGMREYDTPITVRHLMNHTSGLRDGFGLEGWASPREDGDRNERIAWFLSRQRALNFPTGSRYQYNNGAYNLLGIVVKRVSGQSLREFAEANIFKALGMTRTHFHDNPSDIISGVVTGYTPQGNGWRRGSEIPGTVGNSGLQTTVEDLLKWAQNFADPRVGDAALIASMLTSGVLTNGEKTNYGFGVAIGQYRGASIIEHGGGDQGISTYLARFPEHGLSIAVLCNSDAIPSGALETQIADLYLGDKLKAVEKPATTAPPKAATLTAAQLAQEVGWYGDGAKTLFRVWLDGTRLTLNDVWGEDTPFEMTPTGEHNFIVSIAGTPVSRAEFAGNELRGTPIVGGKTLVFPKLNQNPPPLAELQAFAGEFHSDELDSNYKVEIGEGTLAIIPYGRPAITLDATGKDVFTGSGVGSVRFSRNARGAIDGFTLSRALVEGIHFQRVI